MYSYILAILLLISGRQTQIVPTQNDCPSTTNQIFSCSLYIYAAFIRLELNVPANRPNKETHVYNYPLVKAFETAPSIAIGITNLESQGSPYLMLNIKPLLGLSANSLSFLVRFYYRYTNCNLVVFNFIAENRADI